MTTCQNCKWYVPEKVWEADKPFPYGPYCLNWCNDRIGPAGFRYALEVKAEWSCKLFEVKP
jgi:hypothetical protein